MPRSERSHLLGITHYADWHPFVGPLFDCLTTFGVYYLLERSPERGCGYRVAEYRFAVVR
ncbi:hypothetical protein GCM10025298_30490 [Natronobiforma cellulositropha]